MANVGLELRQRKMQGKEMSGFKEIVPHKREMMGRMEEKLMVVLENHQLKK